jgi:hypothetical protein
MKSTLQVANEIDIDYDNISHVDPASYVQSKYGRDRMTKIDTQGWAWKKMLQTIEICGIK